MRYRPFVLALVLALFVPALAHATSVIALDFKTMAGNASVIVVGRVTALNSVWATDRQGIDTFVTVDVSHYIKGDGANQLMLQVPGGQIGYLRSVRVGAPVFHAGDEVVLFLASSGAAMPRIVGFNQGVYRVTVDQASGARMVAPPVLMGDVSTPMPIVRGDPSRKPITLAQFENQVRSVLQQDPADRPDRGGRRNDARKR